jgi:hypothetical protein
MKKMFVAAAAWLFTFQREREIARRRRAAIRKLKKRYMEEFDRRFN